jgi:integrase
VDEINRKDILAFLDWMRKNIEVRVPGSESRTYKNKLNYLGTFLARQGIQLSKRGNGPGTTDPGLLYRSDMPKVVKRKPKKFDQETLDALLAKADTDERDYLEFLLWSGFRDDEVQHLQFSDLSFRNSTVTVHAKPQFDWKPKDYEERTITLPTPVTQRIKDRLSRGRQYIDGFRKAGDNDLVFPSATGRPDPHLIHRLHAIAKKVGLNLKGKRAGHMFRKTAGSRVAKLEGLPAAMEFLGHTNIATTALYLAADESSLKKKLKSLDDIYERTGLSE